MERRIGVEMEGMISPSPKLRLDFSSFCG
jgi:hypothetical protein